MEFAIVRFTDEEDAPGIVSTKWIDYGKNTCFFPSVRTEEKKHKLLLAHASPKKEWLICPMRILKTFPNYRSARSHLREAEDTSNLETDAECPKNRKRRRSVRFPCSSEDEEEQSQSLLQSRIEEDYPAPPSSSSRQCQPPPQKETSFQSPLSSSRQYLPPRLNETSLPVSSSLTFSSPLTVTPPAISTPVDVPSLSCHNEVVNKLNRLLQNQQHLWHMMEDVIAANRRMEEKLDLFMSSPLQPVNSAEDDECANLISLLPVGFEDFHLIDRKIIESSAFKKRLLNVCMTVGAKDPRTLVSNILRMLLSDEAGEKYSLTGKSACQDKLPFEKTEVYKLILDICFRSFKESKLNMVREAISDWLMQSKFRKSKRVKRQRLNEDGVTSAV